jgi:hypothetical protein
MRLDPKSFTEMVVPLNDEMSIRYTEFVDGSTFWRSAGSWRTWRQWPFLAPVGNAHIQQKCDDGVAFGCCEHISVVLSGSLVYTLKTASGTSDYVWERGAHNVANGLGYLPTEEFSRTFNNGFSMCCVVQPARGLSGESVYSFEVVEGNATLQKDAYAVHFCGSEQARRTVFGANAGDTLDANADDIAIVIYRDTA